MSPQSSRQLRPHPAHAQEGISLIHSCSSDSHLRRHILSPRRGGRCRRRKYEVLQVHEPDEGVEDDDVDVHVGASEEAPATDPCPTRWRRHRT